MPDPKERESTNDDPKPPAEERPRPETDFVGEKSLPDSDTEKRDDLG